MATHAITWQSSQVYGRHSAATSTAVSVIVQVVELLHEVWRAIWSSSLRPRPRHALRAGRETCGVDDEFAMELHDWNDPDTTDVIPAFLGEHDEPVLCGYLPDYLTGNPYDQNGAAL